VLAVWLAIGAAAGVVGEARLAGGRDAVSRWLRYAVRWPVVRLRLARNPDVCARHDAARLTGQELAAWHAMFAGMRPLAPESGDQPGDQDGGHRR